MPFSSAVDAARRCAGGAALLCSLCLTAASPAAVAAAAADYRVGLMAAPVTLDPRFATDVISYRLTRLLYQSLVEFDADQKPTPGIAHWRRLDHARYRFTLAGSPRFTDGRPVTATDVAATYTSVLADTSRSPHRGGLRHIEAVRVVDEKTVDFVLERPDPLLPGRLVIGILPAELTGNGAEALAEPAGSGPFRFDAWPTEDRLRFVRRADGAVFEFLTIKDATVRVLKLARGEIDVLPDGVSFDLLEWLEARENLRLEHAGGTTFSYLGVNFEHPLTGDRRVRAAIAAAIDRASIVRHLFLGKARIGVSLLPPSHWSSDPDLVPYRYDPERARALVREVRREHGGRPLELVYKTSANPFRLRLATILKAQLDAVGIGIDIRSYDWGTFYADIKAGRFELYSLSWVGLKLPDIYRYVFHSESFPPAGANRGRYVNPRVDALIDAAEAEPSVAAQIPRWREVQRLVHQDLAYIPLWYEDRVAALRADIVGFTLPVDGRWDALAGIERQDSASD